MRQRHHLNPGKENPALNIMRAAAPEGRQTFPINKLRMSGHRIKIRIRKAPPTNQKMTQRAKTKPQLGEMDSNLPILANSRHLRNKLQTCKTLAASHKEEQQEKQMLQLRRMDSNLPVLAIYRNPRKLVLSGTFQTLQISQR
jgi:hypothetical protein